MPYAQFGVERFAAENPCAERFTPDGPYNTEQPLKYNTGMLAQPALLPVLR